MYALSSSIVKGGELKGCIDRNSVLGFYNNPVAIVSPRTLEKNTGCTVLPSNEFQYIFLHAFDRALDPTTTQIFFTTMGTIMKQYIQAFLVIIALVFNSCESPLSEQSLSDPKLISPVVQVIKEVDYKGTTYYRYRCDLYDKYMRSVELKDGRISVNGENLIVVKDLLGTYYMIDDARVKYNPNTQYSFVITLSDQSQYNASVTTHKVNLAGFNAPANHNKTQNMNLTWIGIDSNATMHLTVTSYYKTDTSQGFKVHSVNILDPKAGAMTLPTSEFIVENTNTYEVIITLHSEVDGTIDSRFYLNRRAFSHDMITKSIILQ